LLFGEAEIAEAVLVIAVLAELAEERGCGSLGGGGGVIEFVGEIGSEFAEGGEFFGLLLHAGDLADAVEQDGDAALSHGGDGSEHVGEELFREGESPCGTDGEAVSSPGFHSGERKFSSHLASATDEEAGRTGVAPANLDLAGEDDVHAVAGASLQEEEGAVCADEFGAMGGEPGVVLVAEAIEGWDGAEGFDDSWERRGLGGLGDEGLEGFYGFGREGGFGGVVTCGGDLAPPGAAWASCLSV
jgi:hypothetical protein